MNYQHIIEQGIQYDEAIRQTQAEHEIRSVERSQHYYVARLVDKIKELEEIINQ